MKKNAIIYVNDTTAQVTKAFAKNACVFGTEEFKLWREYKEMFPDAQMQTKTIKKNENQKRRRNKKYENMEEFMETLPNAEELLEEFEMIKKRAQVMASPYEYVLKWFDKKFEGYEDLDKYMETKEAERTAQNAAA